MIDDPSFRQVQSPITDQQLKPLDSQCQRVQFHSQLMEDDLLKLSEFLHAYPNIGLRVYGNYDGKLNNLDFLKYFPSIKRFTVEIWDLESIDGLAFLPRELEYLCIGQTKSKRYSLKFLEHFPMLKTLYIESHTKDFAVIGQLDKLEDLTLRSITLPDLSTLVPLCNLKSLDIKLGGITDLRLLPKIGQLRYLELWLIRGLTDISPIAQVASLQYLFLQALKRVTKLPSFRRLSALRRLHLETLKSLTDLTPICKAPAIEELIIMDMSHLQPEAFNPLVGHPTLRAASIYIGSHKKSQAARNMLNLPQVSVSRNEFHFI